jgi:hypothetical protein
MLEIRRYTAECADQWNLFVAASKNGTFLFDRRYMDYHSDRFTDHSLMFIDDQRLLAVLPAHIKDDTFCSHNGLTYGGLIMGWELRAAQTLDIFRMLNDYLRNLGIRRVHYKCIPWIYHRLPAEEDLYALYHVCHATIVARDYSTNIFLGANMRWERIRRRGITRALQAGITVEKSDDYGAFWQVLDDNLWRRHQVHPVHTLQEITLLHSRFPENIVLYQAVRNGEVLGGVVLYLSPQVVHAQYSSATEEGKKLGVMDLLYDQIMHHDYSHYPYFDFGRSTENADGSGLNEQLVFQKEGFGGRAVCYDTYEWSL